MSDLTPQLLPILQRSRLPGLDLPDSLHYPAYQLPSGAGLSIANLPAGVCRWLGVPELGLPALDPLLLNRLGGEYQRVIVILMDALALHRLQRWMSDGTAPVWQKLVDRGLLAPLTSISPSTTSAAITALWSGRPAAQHGVTGYEMWMREYGVVANTILHSPMSFRTGQVGSLEHAGFQPETVLPFTTLGTHLKAHGVYTAAMQHYTIAHSGLSRMLFRDVDIHSFSTAADLWTNARRLVEQHAAEKLYTWVYWGEVDHQSHVCGPDDERTAAEFNLFSYALEKYFLERLPDALRQGTLLALVADHGQINTRPDPHYDLSHHPGLTRRLHIQPTGENRLVYLHVRPGQMEAVREYVERTWPNQFLVLDPAYAMDAGLFGPGPLHPELYSRVGDLLLAALGDAYLWWGKDNILLGRHGGLHPEEMLVPLVLSPL
ncbi:MAG: alkaline phosphatase family protein [Chloroflexota bacterium]